MENTPPPARDDGICFTIMTFGGWFDQYYKDIYVPAIVNAGLSPVRADDVYLPGAIITDIWTMARRATIVLADLTGKNPNVLYELGLCHAIAKPVILLTSSMDDVPFDLKFLRVLEYDKNAPGWDNLLRLKITQAIRQVLAAPLKSVLPDFQETAPLKSEPQPQHIQLRDRSELVRIEEMAQGASDISATGVTLISFINSYYDLFAQKIDEGCKLRFMILEPNTPAWEVWHQEQRLVTPDDSGTVLKMLDGLMRLGKNCEVRLSKVYLHFSLIITDADKESGRMNVELLPLNVSLHNRPHIHLTKRNHARWFDFFRNQFETLWSKSTERVIAE